MSWLTYVLECKDGSYYCGSTTDLERRLLQHEGKLSGGAKYTRGRGPFKVKYSKPAESQSEALKHECWIKRLTKGQKIDYVSKSEFKVGD